MKVTKFKKDFKKLGKTNGHVIIKLKDGGSLYVTDFDDSKIISENIRLFYGTIIIGNIPLESIEYLL